MSKIKNGGLDQYGAGPSKQQHLGTAGVEVVNVAVRPSTDVVSQSLMYAVRYTHKYLSLNNKKSLRSFDRRLFQGSTCEHVPDSPMK